MFLLALTYHWVIFTLDCEQKVVGKLFSTTMLRARVAELADALDLGSSGQPWGFESPLSHHNLENISRKILRKVHDTGVACFA